MKLSPTLRTRFEARTQRQPNGCLLWTGGRAGDYGTLSIASGVARGSHHVAFFLAHGRWPERLRHTCDTPLCCEATHLLEGTQAENMADKVARGRQAQGPRHGMAKLTTEAVAEMRRLRSDERTPLKILARLFAVCESNVSQVCRGLTRAGG